MVFAAAAIFIWPISNGVIRDLDALVANTLAEICVCKVTVSDDTSLSVISVNDRLRFQKLP